MGTTLTKFCFYFATSLVAFLSPIVWAFWVVIILVFTDTAFGVMRAGRESVKNIQSRKMWSMVTKLIAYCLLVVLAHSLSFVEGQIPFVKLVLFGIGFIEIKSIDENFSGIFGFSFVDKILNSLKIIKEFKRK